MDEILGAGKKRQVKGRFPMDIKYETILRCDLCSNSDTKVIDKEGNVVQCKKCGLKFISPRPTQEDISKIYDLQRTSCPGWGKIKPGMQLKYERKFNFVQRFIWEGKVLDVGAGLGIFLSKTKQTNRWQCFGTETSQYAIDFAKKEFDIALSFGQLEDLQYPEGFFDAISFWHVLEHLPYPSRAIKKAGRILKEDGFLFIAVPNDSWVGRRRFFKNAFKKTINRLPIKKKLKLKRMYPEIREEGNKHLFYFTPQTLTRLLKKYDFQIKKHSIDFNFENPTPKIERKYRFESLFCHFSGVNLSNSILIAAQKKR